MASFFDHQERARGRTGVLVVLFVLGTLAVTAAVSGVVIAITPHAWFVAICVGLAIVGIPFLFKLLTLGGDGRAVAVELGGKLLSPDTHDADERKVLNVVQEMAIASGMPVPPVYVLPEASINAFAAGKGPQSSVIGVSQGAIEQLTRDELQGVMAHEFSHIFHGDVKINMRAIAAIFGLLAVGYVGSVMLRVGSTARPSRKDGGIILGIMLLGLIFIVLGAIGTFFARIMQAAISRQREFLADASAVQYTRNPSGIAGALGKIAQQSGATMSHAQASQFNHLLFSEGVRSMFASHPPLATRIERIKAMASGVIDVPQPTAPPRVPGRVGVGGIGSVTTESMSLAAATLEATDAGRRVSDSVSAWANVIAAVVSRDPSRRSEQERILSQRSPELSKAVRAAQQSVAAMSTPVKMGLVVLACATLAQESDASYQATRAILADIIRADGRIELYEWVVTELLRARAELPRGGSGARPSRSHSLSSEAAAVSHALGILSLLTWKNEDAAKRTLAAALHSIGLPPSELPAANRRSLDALVHDLAGLERLNLRAGEQLLATAVAVVHADGTTTESEYLLLLALSERLGVPLPPVAVE